MATLVPESRRSAFFKRSRAVETALRDGTTTSVWTLLVCLPIVLLQHGQVRTGGFKGEVGDRIGDPTATNRAAAGTVARLRKLQADDPLTRPARQAASAPSCCYISIRQALLGDFAAPRLARLGFAALSNRPPERPHSTSALRSKNIAYLQIATRPSNTAPSSQLDEANNCGFLGPTNSSEKRAVLTRC